MARNSLREAQGGLGPICGERTSQAWRNKIAPGGSCALDCDCHFRREQVDAHTGLQWPMVCTQGSWLQC